MITDCIKNAKSYYSLGEKIETALRYLEETDFDSLEAGEYELRGREIYSMVQSYDTKSMEECRWEAHRQHIDIQYIVNGTEIIGYESIDRLCVSEEYNSQKDIAFFCADSTDGLRAVGSLIKHSAGCFSIFFPQDAHLPALADTKPQAVKKVVVKIAV